MTTKVPNSPYRAFLKAVRAAYPDAWRVDATTSHMPEVGSNFCTRCELGLKGGVHTYNGGCLAVQAQDGAA